MIAALVEQPGAGHRWPVEARRNRGTTDRRGRTEQPDVEAPPPTRRESSQCAAQAGPPLLTAAAMARGLADVRKKFRQLPAGKPSPPIAPMTGDRAAAGMRRLCETYIGHVAARSAEPRKANLAGRNFVGPDLARSPQHAPYGQEQQRPVVQIDLAPLRHELAVKLESDGPSLVRRMHDAITRLVRDEVQALRDLEALDRAAREAW